MKRKICVVVGSRANYGSIKSAMRAIQNHPDLELQTVAYASAMLDKYGAVVDILKTDGFEPHATAYTLIEGETPTTMAKSTGLSLIELSTIFANLKPDVVLTVGDRFETMATTLAAAYMNIPLAHTMGGEVSGNIDENIRHAVTKFANVHFPASHDAAARIIKLGEDPKTVHMVGCPRIDLVADILKITRNKNRLEKIKDGVGATLDPNEDFILMLQHPVTSEYGQGEQHVTETLEAIKQSNTPAYIMWPNADAGSEDVSRGIRKFREKNPDAPFQYIKNLPPEQYFPLMDRAICMVGNSSSALRDGAFIGTPVVNIGTRERNRERGHNVIDANYNHQEIFTNMQKQISNGKYKSDPLFGDGHAGPRIADTLVNCDLNIVKTITY